MQIVDHRVFCISDLHLGGIYASTDYISKRGYRICTQVSRLALFIRRIMHEGMVGANQCELVINGDFIDFLAEDWSGENKWVPFIFDDVRAAELLLVIVKRDQSVFDALREFLAAGCSLTILLGNHDVELSLPAVQRKLEQILDSEGKRFRFISDGQAYVIGPIIIEHGNRYDKWNVIDHDGLRRTRSAQSRREVLSQDWLFSPPAGSWLVASVMNKIKLRYPFVDLLKPENEATIPILLTLAPEYREHLMLVMKLAMQASSHAPDEKGHPAYQGDVKAESEDSKLGKLLKAHVGQQDVEEFFRILNQASPRRLIRKEDEIAATSLGKILSLFPIVTASSSTRLSDRLPALLSALITLCDERPFDLAQENKDYLKPAERLIKRGFKVVLFGHTHLAKKVQLGDGLYLNTGTWADLMRFPSEQLKLDRADALHWLTNFVKDLEAGQLQSHILQIPTYARVDVSEEGIVLNADIHTFSEENPLI